MEPHPGFQIDVPFLPARVSRFVSREPTDFYIPRSGGVFSAGDPEINPQVGDFASRADVMLMLRFFSSWLKRVYVVPWLEESF